MKEFFITYYQETLWVLSVTGGTIFLYGLTEGFFNYLVSKAVQRGEKDTRTLRLLKRIIVSFIMIMGAGLVSYVFPPESMYEGIPKTREPCLTLYAPP